MKLNIIVISDIKKLDTLYIWNSVEIAKDSDTSLLVNVLSNIFYSSYPPKKVSHKKNKKNT